MTHEDAISRENLLLWLDDIKESARKHVGFLLDVQRYIRSMPPVTSQPKTGHWIPVSERLPEKSGKYLAYIINKKDNKLQYIMTCEYLVDGYWHWFPDDDCASDNVIAWMPLPEPYKPQESEG